MPQNISILESEIVKLLYKKIYSLNDEVLIKNIYIGAFSKTNNMASRKTIDDAAKKYQEKIIQESIDFIFNNIERFFVFYNDEERKIILNNQIIRNSVAKIIIENIYKMNKNEMEKNAIILFLPEPDVEKKSFIAYSKHNLKLLYDQIVQDQTPSYQDMESKSLNEIRKEFESNEKKEEIAEYTKRSLEAIMNIVVEGKDLQKILSDISKNVTEKIIIPSVLENVNNSKENKNNSYPVNDNSNQTNRFISRENLTSHKEIDDIFACKPSLQAYLNDLAVLGIDKYALSIFSPDELIYISSDEKRFNAFCTFLFLGGSLIDLKGKLNYIFDNEDLNDFVIDVEGNENIDKILEGVMLLANNIPDPKNNFNKIMKFLVSKFSTKELEYLLTNIESKILYDDKNNIIGKNQSRILDLIEQNLFDINLFNKIKNYHLLGLFARDGQGSESSALEELKDDLIVMLYEKYSGTKIDNNNYKRIIVGINRVAYDDEVDLMSKNYNEKAFLDDNYMFFKNNLEAKILFMINKNYQGTLTEKQKKQQNYQLLYLIKHDFIATLNTPIQILLNISYQKLALLQTLDNFQRNIIFNVINKLKNNSRLHKKIEDIIDSYVFFITHFQNNSLNKNLNSHLLLLSQNIDDVTKLKNLNILLYKALTLGLEPERIVMISSKFIDPHYIFSEIPQISNLSLNKISVLFYIIEHSAENKKFSIKDDISRMAYKLGIIDESLDPINIILKYYDIDDIGNKVFDKRTIDLILSMLIKEEIGPIIINQYIKYASKIDLKQLLEFKNIYPNLSKEFLVSNILKEMGDFLINNFDEAGIKNILVDKNLVRMILENIENARNNKVESYNYLKELERILLNYSKNYNLSKIDFINSKQNNKSFIYNLIKSGVELSNLTQFTFDYFLDYRNSQKILSGHLSEFIESYPHVTNSIGDHLRNNNYETKDMSVFNRYSSRFENLLRVDKLFYNNFINFVSTQKPLSEFLNNNIDKFDPLIINNRVKHAKSSLGFTR